jgi:rhodanese-related sulfurtransferase
VKRVEAGHEPMQAPQVIGDSGLVVVDATWGEIGPMEAAEGVRTIGELEVIDHLERGLSVIDTRSVESHSEGTIPGVTNVPHDEVTGSIGELDPERPTVFFCNGPQCPASPDAITSLLEAGCPPAAMLYYRGGMHDWVSLGLPTENP